MRNQGIIPGPRECDKDSSKNPMIRLGEVFHAQKLLAHDSTGARTRATLDRHTPVRAVRLLYASGRRRELPKLTEVVQLESCPPCVRKSVCVRERGRELGSTPPPLFAEIQKAEPAAWNRFTSSTATADWLTY